MVAFLLFDIISRNLTFLQHEYFDCL